jgi:DNA-binding NtrC family response regulator
MTHLSSNPRIMAVEDEEDLLKMVEIYLRRWGFEVDGFTRPAKALEHFERNHAAYSLVLTDIRMPDMTGLELASRMHKIKPDIKVVLMTAFDLSPKDLETTLPIVKYDSILLKPFRLAEICNAVKKQLQVAR